MMKKSAIVLMGIILSVLSCNRDELNEKKPTGTLKVDIGLYVTVSEISENLKSTWGPEDFKVVIYNSADQEVIKFERAADMPDAIQLETGNYYVIVFSDNDLPAAFNNPYYYGKSEVFTIAPNDHRTVVVNCEQGNTAVSVVYSDNIRNYFDDFTTKVSSSAGSLDFGRDEARTGYFRPLPLTIHATLTLQKADGTLENKVLTGMITTPLPKRKYEIHVNASAGGGSSILTINLDESAGPVVVIDISEDTQDNEGVLENGELLITEIMYDPTAQADAAGEWFEIFNNTNHPVNLKNLVIEKNETEHHIISDSINLSPGNYQVLARSETALAGGKYVYGSSIALNNTGAMISVSNYGTDGTDGSVICSVNYGAQGFPSASGASLCLDPDHLNVLDASAGTSWCVSSSVYDTGDMGTPGGANDSCD
jgi:hypothetical protein